MCFLEEEGQKNRYLHLWRSPKSKTVRMNQNEKRNVKAGHEVHLHFSSFVGHGICKLCVSATETPKRYKAGKPEA